MDKPRRGPVSKQDWKSQHSQLGAVLDIKSRETGFQGLPPSLRLLSLVKPQRFRQPQLQQPVNLQTAGKFTGLVWTLSSEAGLPWRLGPAQRFHGAIHQKSGRLWRSGETVSNRRRSQRCNSPFLYPASARGLGSRSAGGEPGEGSVSRESRGRLPAGPAPPPAQPASLLRAFQPNPPGEAPGKGKAIK